MIRAAFRLSLHRTTPAACLMAAGLLALTIAPSGAQRSTRATRHTRTASYLGNASPSSLPVRRQVTPDARRFMADAARDGMTEVRLARLALKRSSNDSVRRFAQRMIDDHTKANRQLRQLAADKRVKLPTDVNAQQNALISRLSKLSGPAFDHAYANAMVQDHNHAVALFADRANSGRNTDLRVWVENTLPTLRQCQHLAQAMRNDVHMASTGSSTTTTSLEKNSGR